MGNPRGIVQEANTNDDRPCLVGPAGQKGLIKVRNAVGFLLSLGKLYLVVRRLCLAPCTNSTSASRPFRAVV